MASLRVRNNQRANAERRLVRAVAKAAETLGVDAPVFPLKHKDPTYLPILQMEAISDFLEGLDVDDEGNIVYVVEKEPEVAGEASEDGEGPEGSEEGGDELSDDPSESGADVTSEDADSGAAPVEPPAEETPPADPEELEAQRAAEEEALRQKRSEAAKKAAATRKANLAKAAGGK